MDDAGAQLVGVNVLRAPWVRIASSVQAWGKTH
jgi:hypothetical protein